MEFSWTILSVMRFPGLSDYVAVDATKAGTPAIITNTTYRRLSGLYEDSPLTYTAKTTVSTTGTDCKSSQLWRQLTGRNEVADQKCSVVIEFISCRRGIAKLYCCNSLIDSATLKGRIENGVFVSSRWKIIPFFPIAIGYRKDSFRISLYSRDLVINCQWSYRLYTLLGVEEGHGDGRSIFRRLA